jgi:hypothetical protein
LRKRLPKVARVETSLEVGDADDAANDEEQQGDDGHVE